MAQFGAHRKPAAKAEVPPTMTRGDTEGAEGRPRRAPQKTPARKPTASAFGCAYGAVAPRDELSLAYAARRRVQARDRRRKVILVVVAAGVVVAALLAMALLG